MAITIYVPIIIMLADVTNPLTPPPPEETHFLAIRILELPRDGEPVWKLSVSEHILQKEAYWEAQLSTDESQFLTALLNQMPPQSMSLDDRSFDGVVYDLQIVDAQHHRSFRWRNEDWKTAFEMEGWDANDDWEAIPATPMMDRWTRVGTVAKHVVQLVERTRPASG